MFNKSFKDRIDRMAKECESIFNNSLKEVESIDASISSLSLKRAKAEKKSKEASSIFAELNSLSKRIESLEVMY